MSATHTRPAFPGGYQIKDAPRRDSTWNSLTPREKEICIYYVFHDLKTEAVAGAVGISRTRVLQHLAAIYRILGVANEKRLALWMGLHILEIDPEYKGDI